MKITHIIGIIVIGIAAAVIISTAGDASSYVTFSKAAAISKNGNDEKVHIVGSLKKNESGDIVGMTYNPVENPNYFSFIMVDNKGHERKVVYANPKPSDIERSDKVVVVGSLNEQSGHFVADKILLKCPSKYKEDEINTEGYEKETAQSY